MHLDTYVITTASAELLEQVELELGVAEPTEEEAESAIERNRVEVEG